jgi:hypothetical protein
MQKPLLASSLLAFVFALPVALHAPTARADGAASTPNPLPPLTQVLTGDARTEYDAARLLYDDGDFAGASLKFQRAYTLSHDPRLLWNAGASERNLRHYARTYVLVSSYLEEAKAHLTQAERDEAATLLRTIESFVSHVTVTAEPAGTELSIDDAVVATLPTTTAILADMGTRRFRFHKDGFRDVILTREVAGGSPLTLDAKLEVQVTEGTLRVAAEPGNAIRVDGRLAGTGEWQGALPAGVHSLSVDAPERKSYRTDVAIEAGQLTTIRVGLEPLPRAEKPKFVAWPWITGGLAVVAAVGVGTYFAVQQDKPGPPAAAPGTVSPGYWALSRGR